MSVRTTCLKLELGLGLKGGSNTYFSDEKQLGQCPLTNDDEYFSSQEGVWGAAVVGREYSITEGSGGWKIGFGGGWLIDSGCSNKILHDVIAGECCKKMKNGGLS